MIENLKPFHGRILLPFVPLETLFLMILIGIKFHISIETFLGSNLGSISMMNVINLCSTVNGSSVFVERKSDDKLVINYATFQWIPEQADETNWK